MRKHYIKKVNCYLQCIDRYGYLYLVVVVNGTNRSVIKKGVRGRKPVYLVKLKTVVKTKGNQN